MPLIVKFIHHLFESKFSCSVVKMAMSAISKYHIVDKENSNTIGQHSLVSMAKKAFWQQTPPIPRYCATYDVSVMLRHIENLGQNETLTLKQLSEKTAFLVAFSTLSRYSLVPHSTKMSFPNPFLILFSLTVLLRVSSISVLGSVVHDGLDGAAVELLDLEKLLFTK